MRLAAIAAFGFCCCATVRPAIPLLPASLPFVRVDPELSGAVASEGAAKVFLHRMNAMQTESALKQEESAKKVRLLEIKLVSAENFVRKHAWWAQHGLTVAAISALGGAAITATVFVLVLFGGFHGNGR